jgi:hypothetical protein
VLGAAETPGGTRTSASVRWMPVAVGVVTAALAWQRLSGTTRATVWADDGKELLGDRLREGPLQSWFDVYMGYLHVIPRAIADAVVSFVPVDRYAVGMAALSCVACGLVGGLVVRCSADVVRWLPARVALGLATALLPAVPIEVLGNAANLHWVLLWLAPWLLLTSPRSHRSGVGLGVVGLLAALTEIQLAWFLPLALHRRADRRRWWIVGGVLLGLAGQGVGMLVAPREQINEGDRGPLSLAEGYLVDAVAGAWTGSEHVVGDLVLHHGLLPLVPTVLPFVIAAAYVLRRGRPEHVLTGGALLVASLVIWTAAGLLNPWPGLEYLSYVDLQWERFELVRYGIVPALLLVAIVVLAADVAHDRGHRLTSWAVLGALAVAAGVAFDVPHQTRDDGPRWDDEVEIARERCEPARPSAGLSVPIAPDGWWVDLRCAELGSP